MSKHLSKLYFFLLLFSVPTFSFAWGVIGHRVVGEIANSYLNPKAKLEIQKILGNESLALSSTWADFIRSDSNYKYLNTWHYVDFEEDMAAPKMKAYLEEDTSTNAFTKLNLIIAKLKGKSISAKEKQFYLRLLVHIVGDLHQPFHVSPRGDNGGNTIKLNWFNESSNIHRVWDEGLIDYQQLSFTEYTKAINFTSAQQRMDWQKVGIEEWIVESFSISKRLREDLKGETKLGYNYNFKHISTVNEQLLKAGVRLAGILNKIYG